MATVQDYREKAKARWHKYRARQAEAGELRVAVTLPAALVAKLDAAKGVAGRSAVVTEALKEWLRSKPAAAGKVPRRPRRVTV
jgi:hypothetical protein